jgi:predicted nucleic acid-binding protein
MTARKFRQPVVLDTNVFIRSFKARSAASPNRRVLRLWLLEKQLQLVLSRELMDECLEIFEEVLGMNAGLIAQWRRRFEKKPRTTLINLGRRYSESRDPDDND